MNAVRRYLENKNQELGDKEDRFFKLVVGNGMGAALALTTALMCDYWRRQPLAAAPEIPHFAVPMFMTVATFSGVTALLCAVMRRQMGKQQKHLREIGDGKAAAHGRNSGLKP